MNVKQKRFLLSAAIFVAVVAAATGFGAFVRNSAFGKFLELKSYDYRFAFRNTPDNDTTPITILAIDDASLERVPEPLMLWDKHIAAVIRALSQAHARVIGLDLMLSDLTKLDSPGQEDLSGAIIQAGAAGTTLVLGYRIRENGVEQPPDAIRIPASTVGHSFAYLNLTTDIDDFVRRQQLGSTEHDGSGAPGFAKAMANAFLVRSAGPQLHQNDSEPLLINYRAPGHFAQESFYRVLEAANNGKNAYLNEKFAGRIVLISRIAERGEEDLHSTPHYYWQTSDPRPAGRRTPGGEIHANVIWTLINNRPIKPVTVAEQNLINLAVVTLITFFCMIWRPVRAGLAGAAVLAIVFYVSFFLVFRSDVWAEVVSPEAAGVVAFGLTQTANFIFEGREKRRLRNLFARYVDDRVITRIIDNSDRVQLQGTRKPVAVLFADIKGFTTRSETTPAEDVVRMLNEYFGGIIEAIQNHSGTVNSLMGDGIMAIFGAPLDDADAAINAINAAKAMLTALARVNEKFKSQHIAPIEIGIGIHYGEAVIGNMGSPRKMDYTAIGDVVNTASRVEGLTRKTDATILITRETYAAAGSPTDAAYVGEFEVKGRTSRVNVYGIPT
jgi:adenylate cyclase